MVSHHSSAILHFSSFKIIEEMLFALVNFLLLICDEVSDNDSFSDSFLRASLVHLSHNFLFLLLEKGFKSNCSASRNLITKILFWLILK